MTHELTWRLHNRLQIRDGGSILIEVVGIHNPADSSTSVVEGKDPLLKELAHRLD